jgi:hypothetical protein
MAQPQPQNMPHYRDCHAPYFSGRVNDPITDFLQQYKEAADACALTDQQKVELCLRYVNPSLRDRWKRLDGYATQVWADFRAALEAKYAGATSKTGNNQNKLRDLIRRSSKARKTSEEDIIKYYRQFDLLTEPLVSER